MMTAGYRPTEWERITLGKPQESPARKSVPGTGAPGELLSSVDYIRRLICDNREGILLFISVMLICDCEDSVEMLIALAVFLYPMLKG